MKFLKLASFLVITFYFLANLCTPVLAEKINIITPYFGTEENTYINEQYSLHMKDSQDTHGLYIQSIDPDQYQWNLFIYKTDDINHSNLLGANFIYDHYFGVNEQTKNALGFGLNYFQMDLAGKNIGGLAGFDLSLDISSIYARIGRYYLFDRGNFHSTMMPWIGGQLDQSRGDGRVDFPGPGAADFKIDDNQFSWIGGVNFKTTFNHFLQLDAKHSISYFDDNYFNKSSAMVNFFLTQKWGLSYRYNYLETSVGKDCYHIFGVAVVF